MDERRISHYNIDKAIKKLGVTDFLIGYMDLQKFIVTSN